MQDGLDRYSRNIRVAKYVLPVVGLMMMSSIFLFSTGSTIKEGLVFTDTELEQLAEEQRVTNPHYAGVTSNGDAFTVSAEWALPDGPAPVLVELNTPSTVLELKNGQKISTSSPKGTLNLGTSEALLSGGVNFETTDGYTMTTDQLRINLKNGTVTSDGDVTLKGPIGTIKAGSMKVEQRKETADKKAHGVLVFQNGVKMIYVPKSN